jgi:hypothetical protein
MVDVHRWMMMHHSLMFYRDDDLSDFSLFWMNEMI